MHDRETMKYCVYAYLSYVRGVDATISGIAENIARIESRLELMGVSFNVRGQASGGDVLADGLVKASELRDAWVGEMAHHADEIAEARRLCLPVHECRYALWLHVVERRTWDETSRELGYSNAHMRRLAEIGVRELYALMPERWRREPIPNAAPL